MFTNDENNFIKVELNTTSYLGGKYVAERFLGILTEYKEVYLPDRWDLEQRSHLRRKFSSSAHHRPDRRMDQTRRMEKHSFQQKVAVPAGDVGRDQEIC